IANSSRRLPRIVTDCLPSRPAPPRTRSASKQPEAAPFGGTHQETMWSSTWFFVFPQFRASCECGETGMKEQLEEIRRRARAELSDHATAEAIEAVRVRVLGRSGELTEIMRGIGNLAPAERPLVGKLVNEIKRELESRIAALQDNLRGRELERSLAEAKLDVTLPGTKIPRGRIHPVTQMIEEMLDILCEMGFEVEYTQDVEDDFHNFAALNFAPDHPARHMQDTFFLPGGLLLRTPTSNGQIRVLEHRRPPLAVVCPGGCYRRDDPSVRASPAFNQIEGFMIDGRGRITMSHLKGVLTEFAKGFFGE